MDTSPPLRIRAHSDQSGHHRFQSSSKATHVLPLVLQLSATLDPRHPQGVLGVTKPFNPAFASETESQSQRAAPQAALLRRGQSAGKTNSNNLGTLQLGPGNTRSCPQHAGLQFKTRNTRNRTPAPSFGSSVLFAICVPAAGAVGQVPVCSDALPVAQERTRPAD